MPRLNFVAFISEENLAYFYPTPFASVLGNNDKTFKKVTPDTCARKCLEEREFVCRSFDYQVNTAHICASTVQRNSAFLYRLAPVLIVLFSNMSLIKAQLLTLTEQPGNLSL